LAKKVSTENGGNGMEIALGSVEDVDDILVAMPVGVLK
jgi:hypothetical protein